MDTAALKAAIKKLGTPRPSRVFVVYHSLSGWRWRLCSTTNWQIVGGSQESFDSRANAKRAANRECSFYAPGLAVVLVSGALT